MDKIETERLVLRQFTEDDAENVWMNFGSSALVYKYLPWDCHKDIKESRRMVQLWEKRDNVADGLYYCIDLKKGGGEAIGEVHLVAYDERSNSVEVGFCLGEKYWGKGIVTEAVNTFCEHMLGSIDYVWGRCSIENVASRRVFEKASFRFEGSKRIYSEALKGETIVLFFKRDIKCL